MRKLLILILALASISAMATNYTSFRIQGPYFIYKNSSHFFNAYARNEKGFEENVTWRTSWYTTCGFMSGSGVMYTDNRDGFCIMNARFDRFYDTRSFSKY